MEDSKNKFIRIQADKIREKCTTSKYGIINLFKDCEKLGYKLIRYPIGENSELGFTIKKNDDIVIFTNSSSRLSREIFTLAHEIGHVVLHFNKNESFVDNVETISENDLDEKEKEANYFAACLLMPDDSVNRFLDIELENFPEKELSVMDIARMMSEFNVSFDMALNRLEELNVITSGQKIKLDSEKIQKKVGNLLRSVGENSALNNVSETIYIPYEYIEYVIYNFNHNAIPIETLEKALAYYKLTLDDISDQITQKYKEDDNTENLDDLLRGLKD